MPLGVESELAITAFEEMKDCWLAGYVTKAVL